MNSAHEPPSSEQSVKPRRSKSREVASRFLSPTSTPTYDSGHHSPNKALSPLRRKSTSIDTRKHRSLEDPSSCLLGGLWPSSTTTTSSSSNPKKFDSLAGYLGNERLKDFIERKSYEKRTNIAPFSLSKQTSHTEFSRFIEKEKEISAKENHRPSIGGSMRYTTKLGFSRKSSSSSSSSTSSSSSPNVIPGRFSVDENALYKKSSSSQRKSDFLTDNCLVLDFEPEISDQCSAWKNDSPAITKTNSPLSSRKSGIEVSSKYLKEVQSRNRSIGTTWDSNNLNPVSADSSPKMNKKFGIKNVIRRTNSLDASTSQWALSPGRSGSPSMSVENKVKPMSFSSLKPPTSSSRTRGVEKFLNLGLRDLFKSRKSSALQVSSGDLESVHQLRLIHNSLIQWRYANAKADAANRNINNQVQNYLLSGWNSLMKLQHSVVQKKLKLQKEKLEIKMDFILQSQMKALESWADMEKQHLSAISMTKECLHSVVWKVPLVEGAKVDAQSASMALRHAFDLITPIKSMLTASSPGIVSHTEKTVSLVSELAEVVAQEKLLLEECLELFRMISILEIQERSLMCYIIGLNSLQRQIQQVA